MIEMFLVVFKDLKVSNPPSFESSQMSSDDTNVAEVRFCGLLMGVGMSMVSAEKSQKVITVQFDFTISGCMAMVQHSSRYDVMSCLHLFEQNIICTFGLSCCEL